MSQRRDVSPGIALWGDVMCQQLSLPTLNWECQRDKYPFFRDPITTALFAQSNPCAFQSLMHFLFTILDPIDASEKFFGLWPPKSGDKKAESQFRNAIFRWIGRLQKGEWSSAPNPKRAVPSRHEAEAVAEANRLGLVLFDMRVAPSHYISPVGEGPTKLVAKFAYLVSSIETIRQWGAKSFAFAPTVAERPRGKKNKREFMKSGVAARRAEMVGNQFDEASEKASDDAIRLNTASQTASKVCEDVQNANAEVMEEMTAVASEGTSNDGLPSNADDLILCIQSMRSFNRDVTAQVDVLEMVSKQKRALELSLQTINSLNSQALTFPELSSMALHLREGKSVNLDEVLPICNHAWNTFRSYIEKQSIENTSLTKLQMVFQESLTRMNVVDPKLKEHSERCQSYSRTMNEFIKDQQRPIPEPSRAQMECSSSVATSSVPSVEEISAILTQCFGIYVRQQRLETQLSAKGNDVNNNNSNDSQNDENDESNETLNDTMEDDAGKENEQPLNRTLTSPSLESASNDRIELEGDVIVSKINKLNWVDDAANFESALDAFKLLTVSGGESVFSPLVLPRSRPDSIVSIENPHSDIFSDVNLMFEESGNCDDSFNDAAPVVAPSHIAFSLAPSSSGESLAPSLVPHSFLGSPRLVSAHSSIPSEFCDSEKASLASNSIPNTSHPDSFEFRASPSFEHPALSCVDLLGGGGRPERRWSSLGAKDDEGMLTTLGSSLLDDSDAFA